LESIFNGVLLHQLWFPLTVIILFGSPPKYFYPHLLNKSKEHLFSIKH